MWWLRDPDRLLREVAAIDELREREAWLSAATPRPFKDLKFAFEFGVVVNDETFPFTLEYPAFFPASPPLVIPRDGRRLSDHQYGDGGELCLEHRADNWDPSFTGAMMVASTYRLLAGERPAKDERGDVPSAHEVSPGQRLRGRSCRFLSTSDLCAYVASVPQGSVRVGHVVEIKAAGGIWTAYVDKLGSLEVPEWHETAIPDRGYKRRLALLLRIESLNDVPASPDQDFLDRLIEDLRGKQEAIPSDDFSEIQFIVIADAASARMFFRYVNDGKHVVIPYTTVEMTDSGRRLPEGYDVLSDKKVGVVGCGSLGSKIAASLTRCGISRFVLVDEDIFKIGNLVRHELDADSLGTHKVHALKTRLEAIRAGMDVSARAVLLGGQESSGSTASVLEELANCDLLIDATADPQAFNFVGAVAREGLKPMVWAEVYAGGIGGFVARLRPDVEPPPHAARRQYLRWCERQGVPWRREDTDYASRGAGAAPAIADDADVAVIAAHASRIAVDVLLRPEASLFPHPAYVIGLQEDWIFDAPFDTRPIDFEAEGSWAVSPLPERTAEALDFILSLITPDVDADRTGT
jgi:molybdopterin/thiamine biosynthesis adenylyltransferase/ubiquitin-protein ligase